VFQHTNGAVAVGELDGTCIIAVGIAGSPAASWLVV
jgi:hypothetical protein